jgi:cytochrome c-type biogenesis protein CcmF
VLGLLAAALLISTTMSLFISGARKRSAAKGENFFASLGNIVFKARTQSGGYMAHIGIGIILIGLVGSSMYVRDVSTLMDNKPGAKMEVSNYTFTLQRVVDTTLPNGDQRQLAVLSVERDGKKLGEIDPGLTAFARQGQTRLDASVHSELLRDIFVVYQGQQDGPGGTSQLSMNVKINALSWFAWGGFLLLLFGTALAAWPKKARALVAEAPAGKGKGGKR